MRNRPIPIERGRSKSPKVTEILSEEDASRRDAYIAEGMVEILRDLLRSWRVPPPAASSK